MRQVLFEIPIFGGVKVFGYGAMLVLAFISSSWLAWWRARRERLDPEVIADMAFWIFLSGLVGARLFYVIQYWGREVHSLGEAFQYWRGGIVYYGGVIGGAVAFLVYRWRHPFPLRPFLDVLAPSIAIGTLFGRLGCFLNGCCFGDTCSLPWAVEFPAYTDPWVFQRNTGLIDPSALHSLPVHPTQVYSAIDALIILILLSAFYPIRKRDGAVMGLLMLTYPISRCVIEYLRNDEPVFFAGMTISQNISVLLMLGAFIYWAWIFQFPKVLYRDQISPQAQGAEQLAPAPS